MHSFHVVKLLSLAKIFETLLLPSYHYNKRVVTVREGAYPTEAA